MTTHDFGLILVWITVNYILWVALCILIHLTDQRGTWDEKRLAKAAVIALNLFIGLCLL